MCKKDQLLRRLTTALSNFKTSLSNNCISCFRHLEIMNHLCPVLGKKIQCYNPVKEKTKK